MAKDTGGGYLSGVEFARRLMQKGHSAPIVFLTHSTDVRIDQWCAQHSKARVFRKRDLLPAEFAIAFDQSLRFIEDDTPIDVLVFVHGLGGSPEATWGRFPALVRADPDLAFLSIHSFQYPTAIFRLPFTRRAPRIQTLANGLRTYLSHVVDRGARIGLVCHSLGGIVARRFLLEEVKEDRLPDVSKLLLFAVPNTGSALADAARLVSRWNPHLRQLGMESDLLDTLNEDWRRLKMSNRLQICFVVAGQDRIVEEHSAHMMWSNHVETILDKGHRSVVKPQSSDDMAFRILKRFLLTQSPTHLISV